MPPSQFCVTWDSFKNNVCKGFSSLRQNAEFVDMTLAAEGSFVKAHQNVLALASPYLKEILLSSPCQHPIIFLTNITHEVLGYILEYVYTGEVNIPQDTVDAFIKACRGLCIIGVDNIAKIPDDSKKVSPYSKEIVNDIPLLHHTEHNYAAHTTIGTQQSMKINPAPEKVTEENSNVHPQVMTTDSLSEHFFDVTQESSFIMEQENLPEKHMENYMPAIEDQTVTPLSDIQQDDIPFFLVDKNVVAQNKSLKQQNDITEQDMSVLEEDNLTPILLQDNPVTSHNNLTVMSTDNVPITDQVNMPTINQNMPVILQDQIDPPALPFMDQDNFFMNQNGLPGLRRDLPTIQQKNLFDIQVSVQSMETSNLPIILQEQWTQEKPQSNVLLVACDDSDLRQEKPQSTVEPNMPVIFKEFGGMDYGQSAPIVINPYQLTQTEISGVNESIQKDLSDFIVLNAVENNKIATYKKRIQDDVPQFRVSMRGTFQLLLNKYLYHCHHQSHEGYKRRWRCIHYRKLHCQALVDTAGNEIVNRSETHNHKAPESRLIAKFKRTTIYTELSNAVAAKEKLKLPKKKRK